MVDNNNAILQVAIGYFAPDVLASDPRAR
jgi:hypothetical protein